MTSNTILHVDHRTQAIDLSFSKGNEMALDQLMYGPFETQMNTRSGAHQSEHAKNYQGLHVEQVLLQFCGLGPIYMW